MDKKEEHIVVLTKRSTKGVGIKARLINDEVQYIEIQHDRNHGSSLAPSWDTARLNAGIDALSELIDMGFELLAHLEQAAEDRNGQ